METIGKTIQRLAAMENNDDFWEEYCPQCERMTTHRNVDDEVFEFAAECMNCHTVWEMEEVDEDEDDEE